LAIRQTDGCSRTKLGTLVCGGIKHMGLLKDQVRRLARIVERNQLVTSII
jgi:hypothetical protein